MPVLDPTSPHSPLIPTRSQAPAWERNASQAPPAVSRI
ncbi:hypothetical protein RISK_002378 [Rhodopirellula islandica]|uniref:Uncharacterized protein n=1 Tax=Rhodopirellula islandica TaxID=595434 RepID=A0A0J1BGU6_RHOIS|nr:hypothetical protein RISK_002378 [Rhodopirellula islandica]